MEINKNKFSHGMKTMLNGMAEVFDSLGCDNAEIVNTVDAVPAEEKNDAKNTTRSRQLKHSAADTAVSADDSLPAGQVDSSENDISETTDTPSKEASPDTATESNTSNVAPESNETQPDAPSITLDDITKVIVAKLKQDRKKNTAIEQLVRAYNVNTVSELPSEKYEAFLTDLSEV